MRWGQIYSIGIVYMISPSKMAIQAWKWKFLNFSKFILDINLALFMCNINMKKWVMTPGGLSVQSWLKQTYSRVFPTSLAKLSLSSVDSLSRFCWVEINPSGVSDFDIGDMVTDSEIDWETKNILRNSKTELDNRNNHFFLNRTARSLYFYYYII